MLCAVVDQVLHLLGGLLWDPAQQSVTHPLNSTRAHRVWHKRPACACLGHHWAFPACICRRYQEIQLLPATAQAPAGKRAETLGTDLSLRRDLLWGSSQVTSSHSTTCTAAGPCTSRQQSRTTVHDVQGSWDRHQAGIMLACLKLRMSTGDTATHSRTSGRHLLEQGLKRITSKVGPALHDPGMTLS